MIFEHVACSRCGGSGKYSFNIKDGDRCYGCGGKGVKLTARGKAAYEYMMAKRMKLAMEVEVGDLVMFDMHFKVAFRRVTKVAEDTLNAPRIVIYADDEFSMSVFPNTMVRMGFTKEEKQQQIDEAIEYQSTLTKAGKPKKMKTK